MLARQDDTITPRFQPHASQQTRACIAVIIVGEALLIEIIARQFLLSQHAARGIDPAGTSAARTGSPPGRDRLRSPRRWRRGARRSPPVPAARRVTSVVPVARPERSATGAGPGRRSRFAATSPDKLAPTPPRAGHPPRVPRPRRSRAATRPSPPLLPLPVTPGDPTRGRHRRRHLGEAGPRALDQLERRHAPLVRPPTGRRHAWRLVSSSGSSHEGSVIAGSPPPPPCRAVGQRDRRPPPPASRRGPASRPRAGRARPPRHPPSTSMSSGAKTANPERLGNGLLGAEARREVLRRSGARAGSTRARRSRNSRCASAGRRSSARSMRSISSRSRPIPAAPPFPRGYPTAPRADQVTRR